MASAERGGDGGVCCDSCVVLFVRSVDGSSSLVSCRGFGTCSFERTAGGRAQGVVPGIVFLIFLLPSSAYSSGDKGGDDDSAVTSAGGDFPSSVVGGGGLGDAMPKICSDLVVDLRMQRGVIGV